MNLQDLNARFGGATGVRFVEGPGGFPVAEIANAAARASVCLYGAHVMTFEPTGARPVLWMSPRAVFAPGKPIRGGIPVCWPWFGNPGGAGDLPLHGFARIRPWAVEEAHAESAGRTVLRLVLASDDETRRMFPHAFRVALTVTVGSGLDVSLKAHNPGPAPYTWTGALHTYFAVSDIRAVRVTGLEGARYVDTVGGADRPGVQEDPIGFDAEFDRNYLDTESACVIHDSGWSRRIAIAKDGSRSTVVWNPWAAKAGRLADLGADTYPQFVCVETANCRENTVTVPPGGTTRLVTRIALG